MKKFLLRLLPIITIFAACAVFFYPTVTKGLLPVPTDTLIGMYHPWLDQAATTNPAGVPFKNFLITDPIRQQIPWRKLVIDDWKKGILPLWNPYNFSGTGLLSNSQAGVWYPLNIVFLFIPFYMAWTILIIAQPVLAALFLYLYLRNKKIHPRIAIFAGIVWAFCGFSIAWLAWGTIVQTALWLPLILLAVDKLFHKGNIYWAIVFILSSSFALFAGHAQIALYILLFAGIYAFRRYSRWLLGAALAAIVFSSVQWAPMIRSISYSPRLTDAGAWLKDGWFLPWQHLVQFVAPDFFGNPATLNYWGIWNYGEFIGYIGILPLLLALYALFSRKDRLTRFFAVCLGVTILFLLPTPLAKLPYQIRVPFWSALQPTRLMVLVDFCLIVLAAFGLDAYVKTPTKKIVVGIILIGIIIIGLWIYVVRVPGLDVSRRNLVLPSILWVTSSGLLLLAFVLKKRWSHVVVFLIISLTAFDLFRFGWKFTPFTPVEYFFPATKIMSFLQSQQKPFRVMSLDNRILPPNVNAYYGIESIEGYDPVYGARYEEFIAALNRREPNIIPPFGFNRIITSPTVESPLLPLLNVKYILTLEDMKNPNLELMYREGNTRIYFYKKALPRIYAVKFVEQIQSKQQIISRLYDKTFNPAQTAIVEESVNVPSKIFSKSDIIRYKSYSDTTLSAISTLAEDHFVVVANMFDPNWKATVDGKEAKIYRTNYVFMGFPVPKGDHTIKLVYE